MQRRKYSREFKLEAVTMIRERGVASAVETSCTAAALPWASAASIAGSILPPKLHRGSVGQAALDLCQTGGEVF